MESYSRHIECMTILLTISLIRFTCCGPILIFSTFLHRIDLSGYDINLISTYETQNVRRLSHCSFLCVGSCHMFAYHELEQTCRLYDGPVITSILTNGVNPDVKYYSKEDNLNATRIDTDSDGENDIQREGYTYGYQTCPTGMYRNYTECLSCAPGTYQNLNGQESCELCPVNFYQDETGQTECKQCQNSTDWRHGSNPDRTGCYRCWYKLNAYTEGDMNEVIGSIITSLPYECARECDNTSGCLLYTMRTDQGKCYLHSSKAFSWGYNPESAIYKFRC